MPYIEVLTKPSGHKLFMLLHFGNYMPRSKQGIENFVNLLSVSYYIRPVPKPTVVILSAAKNLYVRC